MAVPVKRGRVAAGWREMLLQGEAKRRYVTNTLGSSMGAFFFPSCPEIAEILHQSGLQSMNAMGKQY